MRLFIGIHLPGPLRRRIDEATRTLRDESLPVRWIEPENFHVTLKFLGDVPGDRISDVERVMISIGERTRRFSIQLGGFGAFPTVRRPRVFWIGIEASSELRSLKQDIEFGLVGVGFQSELRAFHPHVTLGRVRPRQGAGTFRGLDERLAAMTFQEEAEVVSVDLFRSRTSPGGTHYSVLSEARLVAA